jgi:hypothetical protein
MTCKKIYAIALIPLLTVVSCTVPRSVLNSGKVVPKNIVRGGINYTFNISSAPIEQSVRGASEASVNLSDRDTVYFDNTLQDVNKAFLAYCLDPITFNNEYYLRFGLGHRMDMGYRNSGDAHCLDVMYQFLGSNGDFRTSDKGGMYGSIGFQHAWQDYKFINNRMFKKMENLFGFNMSRKDFTIPLIFSKSFGPEERTGCVSFGVLYTHSFIKYKIAPKGIYHLSDIEGVPPALLEPVEGKMNYGSYGTFINFKIGVRYVFFNLSLTAYYQNYGRYNLIGGGSTNLEGFSIVPSYGVQFNIPTKKKKKAAIDA